MVVQDIIVSLSAAIRACPIPLAVNRNKDADTLGFGLARRRQRQTPHSSTAAADIAAAAATDGANDADFVHVESPLIIQDVAPRISTKRIRPKTKERRARLFASSSPSPPSPLKVPLCGAAPNEAGAKPNGGECGNGRSCIHPPTLPNKSCWNPNAAGQHARHVARGSRPRRIRIPHAISSSSPGSTETMSSEPQVQRKGERIIPSTP